MTNKYSSLRIIVSCILVCLTVFSPFNAEAAVQSQTVTFPLSGMVSDPDGKPHPKAVVDLYHSNIKVRSVFAKDDGTFSFADLLPGQYQLRIETVGFDTAKADVIVGPESSARIDIKLSSISGRSANGSSQPVSTETSENQNKISESQQRLDKLPVFDQDYIGLMSRFVDPGSVGTIGRITVVDGVESDDVGVSTSAIKELNVNADPYSVKLSRPGFGRIEIDTKSGLQEFHGNLNFTFRNSVFNAHDSLTGQRIPNHREILEGIFTGPIAKSDKTSFLFSLDADQDISHASIQPSALLGSSTPQSVIQPLRNLLLSGQIDHRMNERNSFSVRYSLFDRTNNNQGIGNQISPFFDVLPEVGVDSRFREDRLQYNQQTAVSSKFVNELDVTFAGTRISNHDLNSNPFQTISNSFIPSGQSFVAGGAQIDNAQSEYRLSLSDVMSYQTGRHTIIFGVSIPGLSREASSDHLATHVEQEFSDLTELQQNTPDSTVFEQGRGPTVFTRSIFSFFAQDDFRIRPNLMISAGLRYDWQNFFNDKNNFGPRVSFAYGLGKDPKTVIRGGFGIFYDRLDVGRLQDTLANGGAALIETIVSGDPIFSPETLIENIKLDPANKVPYVSQFNVGIERNFTKNSTISLNYLGSRGFHLLGTVIATSATSTPPFTFTQNLQLESAAKSDSDYLEASYRGRFTRFFTGLIEYRYGVAHDDRLISSTGAFSDNYARSDFDRRHRFETLGVFDAFGLFSLGAGLSLYSGTPFTLINITPLGVVFSRNNATGRGYANLDLRLSRDFKLSKTERGPVITFDLDGFNVLNSTNDSITPLVLPNVSPFLPILLNQGGENRRLQFGLRLRF